MKNKFIFLMLLSSSIFLQGEGYKGTLPDLNIKKDFPVSEVKTEPQNDILPLDKLVVPSQKIEKIDKRLVEYKHDINNEIGQLERIKEVLDNDKSFKNYIAAANVLDLTTANILDKYTEERFQSINKTLSDINDDTQAVKKYWIIINKNAPYVSNYKTNGSYSGAALNQQLNRFSYILDHAIRNLKEKLEKLK